MAKVQVNVSAVAAYLPVGESTIREELRALAGRNGVILDSIEVTVTEHVPTEAEVARDAALAEAESVRQLAKATADEQYQRAVEAAQAAFTAGN